MVIQTLLRICIRPNPADRFWRGWLNVVSTLLSLVGFYLSLQHHQNWAAISTGYMTVWNGVNIWANFIIYYDWKKGKAPPWFSNLVPD
jgi:hypothetical protein